MQQDSIINTAYNTFMIKGTVQQKLNALFLQKSGVLQNKDIHSISLTGFCGVHVAQSLVCNLVLCRFFLCLLDSLFLGGSLICKTITVYTFFFNFGGRFQICSH